MVEGSLKAKFYDDFIGIQNSLFFADIKGPRSKFSKMLFLLERNLTHYLVDGPKFYFVPYLGQKLTLEMVDSNQYLINVP